MVKIRSDVVSGWEHGADRRGVVLHGAGTRSARVRLGSTDIRRLRSLYPVEGIKVNMRLSVADMAVRWSRGA